MSLFPKLVRCPIRGVTPSDKVSILIATDGTHFIDGYHDGLAALL